MRTLTAVLLAMTGVLGVAPAAAERNGTDENGTHANSCPPAGATGGGPAVRESRAVPNARLAPPATTAPSPTAQPRAPESNATVFAVTGQRYGQPTVVAVPSVVVPSPPSYPMPAAPAPFAPYGNQLQPVLTPLSTPPPVVVSDGPSPTVGAGGGGFMLPVPGTQPLGTLTNPNGR